jgi:predicted amidophosphoribosyltransferase
MHIEFYCSGCGMKFCDNCKNTYVSDFNYCPQCGATLTELEKQEKPKGSSLSGPWEY